MLGKMKNYSTTVFKSKKLTNEENAALKKRRELREQDQKNKKDLGVRDGRLYK